MAAKMEITKEIVDSFMKREPFDIALGSIPLRLQAELCQLPSIIKKNITELRLRAGKPVIVKLSSREAYVGCGGVCLSTPVSSLYCSKQELDELKSTVTQASLYAYADELARGFITVPGGHRIGFCGSFIYSKGEISGIKEISSAIFRIAREKRGCACEIMPKLLDSGQNIRSTLIISPPGGGKTTVLRDIVRMAANGENCRAKNVSVIDERSEIAAVYGGIPLLDVGIRADIYEAAKKDGFEMALRSGSPQVIACDEIGTQTDADAVELAVCAGVSVVATLHAGSIEEAMNKRTVSSLIKKGMFEKLVLLSGTPHPGTLSAVVDLS